MRRVLVLAAAAAVALSLRPKHRDSDGHELIDMADVGETCADAYFGYAMVNGYLEKCDNYTALQMGGGGDAVAYEEYKCRHLRVHGHFTNDKCVCKDKYSGPYCSQYVGCPTGSPHMHNGVCTSHVCQNGGKLAIGSKHLECICTGQWDGRYCERLACWRLTDKGQDKRYRNDQRTKSCLCGEHFMGKNCDIIKSCSQNGNLTGGVCVCDVGYGGEVCERKCPKDQVTCTAGSLVSLLSLISLVFAQLL